MKKGKSGIKKPYLRKIYDSNNNLVGEIKGNSICDANGNPIAELSGVEKSTVDTGKKTKIVKQKVFSSVQGEFRITGGHITLNGLPFGIVNNAWIVPTIVTASATTVAVAATVTALIVTNPWKKPEPPAPFEINISDANGRWEETVDMFPSGIYPGSEGEHPFVITNSYSAPAEYSFRIAEIYNEQKVEDFPVEYRIIQGGQPMSDEWCAADELEKFIINVESGESLACALQWRWIFERGNDDEDTMYGKSSGRYSLDIVITGAVDEEDTGTAENEDNG